MIAILFGSVVPTALKETQQGGNYSEAALVAQHKMDQLRTTTALISEGIIDSLNSDGSYDFSTNSQDNLASYFPSGTTGTIVCSADTATGTMSSGVYDVTITISWPQSGAPSGSFSLKDKIINY